MNLIEQIARQLELFGFGTAADNETDGNIHWGRMPDKPDNCICVYSTNAAVPGDKDGARIQIMNRAKSPREAFETSANIAAELDGWRGFLGGDGSEAFITITNSAQGLGPDTMMREIYVSNIRVTYC